MNSQAMTLSSALFIKTSFSVNSCMHSVILAVADKLHFTHLTWTICYDQLELV